MVRCTFESGCFDCFHAIFLKDFRIKVLGVWRFLTFFIFSVINWRTFLLSFGGDDGKIASLEKKNKERSFKRRTVYSSGQGLSMAMRLEC